MAALTGRRASLAIGFAFAATMFGTTLPTPLYPLYRSTIGFSELVVTVIYAVYAAGVLAALLGFGQLSDRIGRRPVLLAGIALSALSAVAFLVEGGLPALLVGRVLSGLSAGLFTGTATATLLDLAPPDGKARATLAATVVNIAGLGLGPLVAGLVSQYVGLPLRSVFGLDLALLVPAALLVLRAPEPIEDRRGFRLRMTRLAVPPEVRPVFARACAIGFAGFVVLGLFSSVVPAALGELMDTHSRAVVGAVVFGIFLASIAGQLAVRVLGESAAMPVGCGVLLVGMGVLAGSLQLHSLALITAAGLVAGLGQGMSFRSGLSLVSALTPARQRGEVTSAFFTVLYVGISLPVVAVGLAARSQGLQATGIVTSGVVAALALGTLLSLLRPAAG